LRRTRVRSVILFSKLEASNHVQTFTNVYSRL
jgi:hypothetical protein